MAAPTYDGSYTFTDGWNTLQTTSDTTTATFTVNPDDLIVVFAGQSNYEAGIGIYNVPSISDDYNLQWGLQSIVAGVTQWCPLLCYTAVNTYSTSITITITLTLFLEQSTSVRFGGKAYKFSFADGIGFKTNALDDLGGGSYNLAISPFRGDSLVVFYILDWDAFSLSDRSYGTNNGFSPTEIDYATYSNYSVAAALYNTTVAGDLSFLTSQSIKSTLMAIEILGSPFGLIPNPGVLGPIQATSIINKITTINNATSITI